MREALPKLRRRLNELEALDIDSLEEGSYRNILRSLENKIDATLIEIFGTDTIEYRKFGIHDLDATPLYMGMGPQPITYYVPGIHKGMSRAISKLKTAIDILSERGWKTLTETAVHAFLEPIKGSTCIPKSLEQLPHSTKMVIMPTPSRLP
jgi:hypothetical protein